MPQFLFVLAIIIGLTSIAIQQTDKLEAQEAICHRQDMVLYSGLCLKPSEIETRKVQVGQ